MKIFGLLSPFIAYYAYQTYELGYKVPVGFAMFSVIIFTTFYVNEIDLKTKRFTDCFVLLGLRINKTVIRYNKLDNLSVEKETTSQRMQSKSRDRVVKMTFYTVYVNYDDDAKFALYTASSPVKVQQQAEKYSRLLDLNKN